MTDFILRYYASADSATLAARFLMGAIESGMRYGYQIKPTEHRWDWQRTINSLQKALAHEEGKGTSQAQLA